MHVPGCGKTHPPFRSAWTVGLPMDFGVPSLPPHTISASARVSVFLFPRNRGDGTFPLSVAMRLSSLRMPRHAAAASGPLLRAESLSFLPPFERFDRYLRMGLLPPIPLSGIRIRGSIEKIIFFPCEERSLPPSRRKRYFLKKRSALSQERFSETFFFFNAGAPFPDFQALFVNARSFFLADGLPLPLRFFLLFFVVGRSIRSKTASLPSFSRRGCSSRPPPPLSPYRPSRY